MDAQQLQMIMDALQGMGAAGKDAFIWWLLLDKALPVVGMLIVFGGLLWLALRIISVWSAESNMARLRDEMGVGCPGPLWPSEAKEVLRRVRELMKKQEGQQ